MKKSEALDRIYDLENFLPLFPRSEIDKDGVMGILTGVAKIIAEIDEL